MKERSLRENLLQKEEERAFMPVGGVAATAVNQFLGIDYEGILPPKDLPKSINLYNFWQEASSIINNHPVDRELYMGWDLEGDDLQVSEVVEGLKKDEIPLRENYVDRKAGKRVLGRVTHKSHLINFHTHVFNSENESYEDKRDKVRRNTPHSSYSDLEAFVLIPSQYADIIVDISNRKDIRVGRVFAALKTTDSWWDINRRNLRLKRKELLWEMYRSELTGVNDTEIVGKPIFARQGTEAMVRILRSDEHWSRFAGISIYRGLILSPPQKKLVAYRWDVFYQKLRAIKKSSWPFTNWGS